MKKKLTLFLIVYLLINMSFLKSSIAQNAGMDEFVKTTQIDLLTIAGAGAGGAILGLSTLSFVDKPSKHIPNIWTGAAIGIIAGVVFVGYNSAQRGSEDLQSSREFNSIRRLVWHQENTANNLMPQAKFSTDFWQISF